ncbi:MAG: hypothetical protein KDC98_14120 [Planctomycetes bacterium]|nr:hypothetical protein [Planctomycetota bacterium]
MRITLAAALCLSTFAISARTQSQTTSPIYISSLPPTAPAELGWNSLDLSVEVPGNPAVQFSSGQIPVPGNPGWHGIDTSPLGPIVFVPVAAGAYLMALLNYSVTIPLSWNRSTGRFAGTDGVTSASVEHTEVGGEVQARTSSGQGGGGPCVDVRVKEVPRPDGNKGIRIEVDHPCECTVAFFQFFRQNVTYEDGDGNTHPCPIPVAGTGNNERPAQNHMMYVDSSRRYTQDGSYPAEQPVQNGSTCTTAMEDGPEIKEPDALQATLEVLTEGRVTKIHLDVWLTTYVLLTCPPNPADIVAVVEWNFKRTYVFPPPAGGQPAGEVGGPNPGNGGGCGFPNSSPNIQIGSGQTMGQSAQNALNEYLNNRYGGSR